MRLTVVLLWVALGACNRADAPPSALVVFVCEHGAAKSVIAAAHFNRLAAERGLAVRAVARGADPQDGPSKSAEAGLRAEGIEPLPASPAPLTVADVRGARRLVSFDCDVAAMKVMKGLGTCWNDIPTVSDDYARARDLIDAHATVLVDELAMASGR